MITQALIGRLMPRVGAVLHNITPDVLCLIKATCWNPYVYRGKMHSMKEKKKRTSLSENIIM